MKKLAFLLVLFSSNLLYSQSQDTTYINVFNNSGACGYGVITANAVVQTEEVMKIVINWGDGSDTTIYDVTNATTIQYYYSTELLIHPYAVSGTYTISMECRAISNNAILIAPVSVTQYFCGLDVSGTEHITLITNSYSWTNNDPPFDNIALDFEGANGTVTTRYSDSLTYFIEYDSVDVTNYPMTVSLNEQWSADHHLYQLTPDVHFTAPQSEDDSDWFYLHFNGNPHLMVYDSEVENQNTWIGGVATPSHIQLTFNNTYLAKPDSLLRIHLECDAPLIFDTSNLIDPVVNGNSIEFSVIYINMHKSLYVPFVIDSANAEYGNHLINGYIMNHTDTSALDDSLHVGFSYNNPNGGTPVCDSVDVFLLGGYSGITAPTQSGSLFFCFGLSNDCFYPHGAEITIHFPAFITPATGSLLNANFIDSTLTYDEPDPMSYSTIPLQVPGSVLAGTPYQITISFNSPGDTDTTNNSMIVNGIVLNSYDPNEKIVDLPTRIDPTVQEQLNYTIHFQNEGNLEATNITVVDTISENLDISTFRFISAKHNCTVWVDPDTRVAYFYFPNINLTPKTVSEDSSQSILTYVIKELPGNGEGTEIRNTAYIYFDYNDPIVTNTTYNINSSLSVSSQNEKNIVIYPNPAQNSFSISGQNLQHLTVFDLAGKAILEQELTNSNSVHVENLADGIYTCVITSKTGVSQQKLIIKN